MRRLLAALRSGGWPTCWWSAESSAGQATLGKRLFGIRVGSADGSRLGLPSASLRAWPHYLGSLAFLVIAIAFSGRKQGLHDRMAGAFLTRR